MKIWQEGKNDELSKDLTVRSEKMEINGLYCVHSLKDARRISTCGRLMQYMDQRSSIQLNEIYSLCKLRLANLHVG